MKETEHNLNRDNLMDLVSKFDLGMAEKSNTVEQDQPRKDQSLDLCLPPLLVEAFQSGLEEEFNECNCGCEGEHDCTQHSSSSGHHDCGGCNHHG